MIPVLQVTHRASLNCQTDADLRRLLEKARPGDVLFGMALLSGPTGFIRYIQGIAGYPEKAMSASHVALYAGDGLIIHATFGQGCVEEPASYLLGRDVVLGTWHHARRDAFEGQLIAEARTQLRSPYEMGRMFVQTIHASAGAREPFICSTFVSAVFRAVMGREMPLHDDRIARRLAFVSPAHLFVQPGLVDP